MIGISLVFIASAVVRSPDLIAITLANLTELLRHVEFYTHLDSSLLRSQEEFLQTLYGQAMPSTYWQSFDLKPRSISFSSKFRIVMVIAATDVSVIIPTLNEEKYLPKCLKSLMNQSKTTRYEIIVVDGGSTDETVEIAKEYATNVIVNKGQLVGASRNAGARAANGNILAFIDGDTMASGHWLREISHSLGSTFDAVGVTGPTLPYDGTRFDELVYRVATGWMQHLSLKFGHPHVAGLNCAYKKDAFWLAGGFDEQRMLSEDVALGLRIHSHGRILFNPMMIAYTSLRRIKQHGYAYLTTYYAINAITMTLFSRNLAYPRVR